MSKPAFTEQPGSSGYEGGAAYEEYWRTGRPRGSSGMNSFDKPIKVTVSDPETGEEIESRVVANDYVLICAGNRYIKSVQAMGKPGRLTHMIAIAVKSPQ